ncbi:MAG: hypothetical protein Q9170_004121 [Blastenia crenularia]
MGSDGGNTNVGKPLATTFVFASMRFLARMSTNMDGERAALDEAFVAISPGADVGTVIGVYAIMPDQVRLAIELLQKGSHWVRAWELLGMLKASNGSSPISSHDRIQAAQRGNVDGAAVKVDWKEGFKAMASGAMLGAGRVVDVRYGVGSGVVCRLGG